MSLVTRERIVDEINRKMYAELGTLARNMELAVRECRTVNLPPLAVTTAQLPRATEHLSDLSRLTEQGTHKVMELTEQIQDNHAEIARALDGLHAQCNGDMTESQRRIGVIKALLAGDNTRLLDIMTALSFQDLVGQRINKIVGILQDVEHKLLEMVVVFGVEQVPQAGAAGARAEEILRQLEASKKTALSQNLVDDILAEFGFDGDTPAGNGQ
jgi:chemotaxis protein CheZ